MVMQPRIKTLLEKAVQKQIETTERCTRNERIIVAQKGVTFGI